jgi:lipopolysaccharide export system protein LptA
MQKLNLGWMVVLALMVFANQSQAQRKVIQIKQADRGELQKIAGQNINVLVGNVVLEHEGALMYCDSARVFQGTNNSEAYGNVRINQGDTLFLSGKKLLYNGGTKVADVYDDVVMRDPQMTLTTNALKFDRVVQTATYQTGGRLVSEDNVLTSKKGVYHSNSKLVYFKDSVLLVSPRYKIESDTLIFSTESEIAYFRGPTNIYNDSSSIYTERGQHDTRNDISSFTTNTLIFDAGRFYKADSLYYNSGQSRGQLFGNARIHDTIENQLIVGNYADYASNPDRSFVTGDAILSLLVDDDSLHIHADTLLYDTRLESTEKELRAFFGVRIFKSDFQGVADSLFYSDADSIFKLYRAPALWNDQTQMTGDSIYLELKNGKVDSLHLYNNAFLISESDSGDVDQIRGRNMFGSFRENKLYEMHVIGNGQTAYAIREGDGTYVGLNRADCSNLKIRFKDNAVSRITFMVKPDAKLYPLELLPEEEKQLKGFNPRFSERPLSKNDLILKDSDKNAQDATVLDNAPRIFEK